MSVWELIFGHNCFDYMQHRHIQFVNNDPDANPNPLSIYGPVGSYWLELTRCTKCGHYSGKRYDTHGGWNMSENEARRAWKKEEVLA